MSKCKTSCRYKVYDPCSYIHEVKHVILQNPVSIQSLQSTLLYTRRDACDTRQKCTDRCNSNTKYQRNQEIANLRLDAKTRFLAAAKDPNRKEDISTLIQASGLSKSAAYRYLAGGLTKAESNKSKAWLSPEEEEAQVDELLALAARGFGEVRKQIAQRIEDYIRIRDNNPHFQIGKNYVYNFCQRHHNRLQMYWTTSLTTIQCKAMSPEILEHWWKLLADWFTKFGIKTAKQIFGADEV